MKRKRWFVVALLTLGMGFMLTQCKKKNAEEELPASTMLDMQSDIVKNSDLQDAIADRADMELDNLAEEIQSNTYLTDTTTQDKSMLYTGSRHTSRTIGNRDTIDFPKIIKVDYTNYQDTTTDEKFVKNGEVIFFYNASKTGLDLLLVTKDYYYRNFLVSTDSTTISITGSRRVTRVYRSYQYNGVKSLKLNVTDHINANMRYAIVKTGSTDSVVFTRKDTRVRKAALFFQNRGGNIWATRVFKNVLDQDTIQYTGTIAGTNEKGEGYTKTINTSTPLIMVYYRAHPIISGGTMNMITTGSNATTYTITYQQDSSRPSKTQVSITDDATSQSCFFDRTFCRTMHQWW